MTRTWRSAAGALQPVAAQPVAVRAAAWCGWVVLGMCGLLLGCPLYDDRCVRQGDCAVGFYCSDLERCEPLDTPPPCTAPSDCTQGQTCTPDFVCRPGSCDYHGCLAGYTCGVANGAHACVPPAGDVTPPEMSPPNGSPPDAGTIERPDGSADTDADTPDASAPDAGPS
jgi:hypothetical protein